MTSPSSEQHWRERVWDTLGCVEDHPQVKAWLDEAAAKYDLERSTAKRRKHFLRAVAASVALVALIASGLAYWSSVPQHYETAVGEQRDVILPDGSRVTLNTNTAVSVHYSKERRYLVLERGEALFSVAHNAARPFDVAAGGIVTRAIGTEFNVDMRSARVTVSVLEGSVQVATPDSLRSTPDARGGSSMPYRAEALAKGQALELHPKEHLLLREKADLDRIDAWRARRLEFSNTSLAQAVEEFNRYSRTQLWIGTRELAERRVSGIFRIGDIEGFVYTLHEALGVESHESGNEIVLMQAGN